MKLMKYCRAGRVMRRVWPYAVPIRLLLLVVIHLSLCVPMMVLAIEVPTASAPSRWRLVCSRSCFGHIVCL